MGLTDEEKRTLAALNKKAKEPDPPPVGKSVNITIDPKDPDSVAFAVKHGFLRGDDPVGDADGGDDGDGDGDDDADETPKRKGFFPD